MSKTITVRDYKYIKRKGLDSLRKIDLNVSEHMLPEDLGYKEAMIQAEWILNDFVPSNATAGKKWV